MKKRLFAGLLAFAMIIGVVGCGSEQSKGQNKEYKEAVKAIQSTELKLDGSNELSGDILVALKNAKYTEAKNIIFMIGDGMGHNIVEATQTVYADELYEGKLAINYLPVQSSQTTYSVNSHITDSAAGGTALATGHKTKNTVLGMDMITMKEYQTVLELAAEKGKSTGVVVTDEISEATPASYTAHTNGRGKKDDIAKQQIELMLEGNLDIALGGGRTYFEGDANKALMEQAKNEGVTYSTTWEDTINATLPIIGSYAESRLDTTDEKIPSLAAMTDFALEKLSENKKGFFLMVEGAQIDDYAEFNDLDAELREMYDFDCAIAVAMRYVALNPDTVLIITADHDTGDLEIPMDATAEQIKSESTYSTDWHIYKSVPLVAIGYRTEELNKICENTDVAAFVASLLGKKEFGAKSTTHTLYKANEDANIKFAFDVENNELQIPLQDYAEITSKVVDLRTIHITLSNATDKTVPLPQLQFVYDKLTYNVKPDKSFLKAGETMTIGYVIPTDAWATNMFGKMTELKLVVENSSGTLNISKITVTERSGTK